MNESPMIDNKGRSDVSPTPYDDGFKTLLAKRPKLIIPVVNEMFGTSYDEDAEVKFLSTEFQRQDGKTAVKRETSDSCFQVAGYKNSIYIIECQSKHARNMLIRLAQYGFDAAVRSLHEEGSCVTADFPRLGCLYLRPPGREADLEGIRISFQDGQEVMLHPVLLDVQKYEFTEIDQKNLLFLTPFRMFVHEKEFKKQQDGNGEYGILTEEIRQMMELLGRKIDDDKASVYDVEVLSDVAFMVMRGLEIKYPVISKEVEDIMGGSIVATPRYDRLVQLVNDNREQGREQGLMEGISQEKIRTAYNLLHIGLELSQIAQVTEIPRETVAEMWDTFKKNRKQIIAEYNLDRKHSSDKHPTQG